MRLIAILSVFVSFVIFVGCNSTIEPLNRNSPPLEPGAQQLVITIQSPDGSTVSDYNIVVEGPETSIDETTSAGEYVINPIATGTYVVSVSKTGFRGQDTEIDVDLSDIEESDDFSDGALLLLTKLNDPVTVGAAGGEINVPATGSGSAGTGSEATTVTVPPGAVADGTEMSVTVVPPPTEQSGSDVTSFTLVGEPEGLEFDEPIKVEFPIPANVAGSGVQMNMVYASTGETLPVTIEGNKGIVYIPHFSDWNAEPDVTLTINIGSSTKKAVSGCGDDLSQELTLSGRFGGLYRNVFYDPGRINATTQASKSGQAYFKTIGTAAFSVINYEITSGGTVIESGSNIPRGSKFVRVSYSTQECHDSGG